MHISSVEFIQNPTCAASMFTSQEARRRSCQQMRLASFSPNSATPAHVLRSHHKMKSVSICTAQIIKANWRYLKFMKIGVISSLPSHPEMNQELSHRLISPFRLDTCC